MRTGRAAYLLGGLLVLVLSVPVIHRSPDATFGGSDPRLLALEVAVAMGFLVTAAAGVPEGFWVVLGALGLLWLVPELAGAVSVPVPARTLADTAGTATVVLLVTALVLRVEPRRHRAAMLFTVVIGLLLAAGARLFLVDPFDDVECWRTCDHNPLLLHSSASGRWVLLAGLLALANVAAWGAVGAYATPFTPSSGWAAPTPRTLGWLVAVSLAAAALVHGPAGSASADVAVVLFVSTQVAAVAWLGAIWWGWAARWRLERRLVRLAEGLHDTSTPDTLPTALRTALRDPTLRLWFWAPDLESFVDPWGNPARQPVHGDGAHTTSVTRDGRLVALVVHNSRVDPGRLDRALRPPLRLALENHQLRAAATAELAELTASRRKVVELRQAERARLERNLHDGAQQHAFSLGLFLGALLARCGEVDREAVTRAQALTQVLLDELRTVAHGIHPTVLADAGLEAAFLDLAERSTVLPVTVGAVPGGRYPAMVETAAYLVVREWLTDAEKRGASQVTISAAVRDGVLRASVQDDAPHVGAVVPVDLADQVGALGGRLVTGGTAGRSLAEVRLPCGS